MQLQPFSRLSSGQLATIVHLYRDTFEAPWEWPRADIAALADVKPGTEHYWAQALLLDGQAAGFAIADYLAHSNLWYLHYLAIAPPQRSRGLGSWILREVLATGEAASARAGRGGCRGTVIEAEAIDGPPLGADRQERERREAFYRGHGAIRTGVRYPRPPDAPPDMPEWDILLVPGAAWNGVLDREARQGIVRALCVEGYGIPADTPYLVDYLAAC